MASRCDAIVVIGSANSSNTVALEKLARESGCPAVFRINGPEELPADLRGVVGVTAGASAPEELVQQVIDRIAPGEGLEVLRVTEEDEYFPPPRQLRELQGAIGLAARVLLGAGDTGATFDDRALPASDVLAALRR
jgi:4-hydroxy-3-methylbut-2-enyl diphosphate reductase